MPNQSSTAEAMMISFVSQEDDQSDLAALTIVRRISHKCGIMLIKDVHNDTIDDDAPLRMDASDRVRRLKSLADRLGLEHTITVREMNEGLSDLRRRAVEDVIVFHQPSFALDRQTQIFRRIERALGSIPNSVLYAPGGQLTKGRDVIAFARDERLGNAELAERLMGPEGTLKTLGLEKLAEFSEPRSQLRLQIQSQSPAMILIEEEIAVQMDALYSRLAAVLSTPVLVITPPPP
jgi:hypothetical protein